MKMKKRILAMSLILAFLYVIFAGCSSKPEDESSSLITDVESTVTAISDESSETESVAEVSSETEVSSAPADTSLSSKAAQSSKPPAVSNTNPPATNSKPTSSEKATGEQWELLYSSLFPWKGNTSDLKSIEDLYLAMKPYADALKYSIYTEESPFGSTLVCVNHEVMLKSALLPGEQWGTDWKYRASYLCFPDGKPIVNDTWHESGGGAGDIAGQMWLYSIENPSRSMIDPKYK